MTIFDNEGIKYEVLVATDDNGIRCELWDYNRNKHLLDIFKNEELEKIDFYATEALPFHVVERVIKFFNEKIGVKFNSEFQTEK